MSDFYERLKGRREIISYLFFGGLSFALNIGVFWLLDIFLDYRVANVITLILNKIFVFITNKVFVFRTHSEHKWQLLVELLRFLGSRLVTNFVDFFGLILMVELINIDRIYSKIFLQIIVITLNYVFSKHFVFYRKDSNSGGKTVEDKKIVDGNFYNKYESKNPIARKLMSNFFIRLGFLLDKAEYKSVYEAGCGEGYVTRFISQRTRDGYNGMAIFASDISQRVVDEARQNVPGVHFAVESVYDINHPDNSFDLVIASEVLEHLEQPELALKELLRVTNRYLLISVPNEPIWRALNMVRGKYIKDFGNTPGHIQHWDKRSFIKFVKAYCSLLYESSPFPWTILLCEKLE